MIGNDIRKLNRLKAEQIAKSKKNELFKSYIDSSKNLDDKIAIFKLKHQIDKNAFISSIKNLMKKK